GGVPKSSFSAVRASGRQVTSNSEIQEPDHHIGLFSQDNLEVILFCLLQKHRVYRMGAVILILHLGLLISFGFTESSEDHTR
ncbi:hypothetical protein PGIGA_G00143740, partial [Pangasianodon gigas]|nr:hypothetical protein [Pangasianodon gigas]